MAHVGNPWMTDCAEVVYKNINVWADLSGPGGRRRTRRSPRRTTAGAARRRIRPLEERAFRYAERPNRFLYGTDWPLAPMAAYRDFVRGAIPADCHELVFEENARLLFRLGV